MKITAALMAVLLVVSGCGDASRTDAGIFDPGKAAQLWNTTDKTWSTAELEILEGGRSLYKERCSGCHQRTGTGLMTIGAPALKGSAVAKGSVDILARTVLFGRGSMPAFRNSIDDTELAMILSYVRNAWDNNTQGLVQESRVASLRGAQE